LLGVQYHDEASARIVLSVYEFAEELRPVIAEVISEMLLERGTAILKEGYSDLQSAFFAPGGSAKQSDEKL
jgi:hypothetical protein